MLKYKSLFLRPVLVRNLGFNWREHIFPSKLTWTVGLDAVNLNLINTVHSRVQIAQKGLGDHRTISSMIVERNMMVEKNRQDLHFPYAYDNAMDALSSLISGKRRGDGSGISDKYNKLDMMSMYIKILGLEEHIAGLKIIHVTGTKGKGSTCAFCEAILRECGFRTGLFTSPHLIDVRERFRLHGLDISEEKFLQYFWENWHQLKENVDDDLRMPPLFQFLTLLAFKIFACEKVDVAIIEVGLGGTRDPTNVIKDPVVCGISPLGMDHMEILGDTLGKIASEKAGIFKPRVPAFTVPQLSEAMEVLRDQASDLMVPLEVVPSLDRGKLKGKELSLSGQHQLTNAGLAVALCKSWLKRTGHSGKLLKHADMEDNLPEAFLRGLWTARLLGRAQIVYDSCSKSYDSGGVIGNITSGGLVFYLDGAHTPESTEACAAWFSSAVKENKNQSSIHSNSNNSHVQPRKDESDKISKNILLFNCMDVRDPQTLLPRLVDTCNLSGVYFAKAIFVPSISTYNKVISGSSSVPLGIPIKNLTWQFNLQRVWEKIIHGKDSICVSREMQISEATPPRNLIDEDVTNCSPADGRYACSAVASSLPTTISWLRNYAKENPTFRIQVLVTGSLHLVGDVLKLLRR